MSLRRVRMGVGPLAALAVSLATGIAVGPRTAIAGVFNLPRFVHPGDFAIGLEPELMLTGGTGLGANIKYTHGLNDLLNLQAHVGIGSPPRGAKVGATLVLDFFPDIDKQPGLGIGVQSQWQQLAGVAQLEFTAIPYIHKSLITGATEVDPYFAFPFGLSLRSDTLYQVRTQLAVGALFKTSEHFRFGVELGVAVANTDTYFSGGVTYYR